MPTRVAVEICVGDLESAIAAEKGGADRIELCANLLAGGTSPSAGTIAEACRRLSIPVHVLIRPHEGGFVYSEPELAVMRHEIEFAKAAGANGVVLGVLTSAAMIDRDRTAELAALARPMSVTFHKAFDQTRNLLEALELLIELGVEPSVDLGRPADRTRWVARTGRFGSACRRPDQGHCRRTPGHRPSGIGHSTNRRAGGSPWVGRNARRWLPAVLQSDAPRASGSDHRCGRRLSALTVPSAGSLATGFSAKPESPPAV